MSTDRTPTTPQRVQRKRAKGWRMPENTVCVDRTTGFGNPFPVVKGTSSSMGQTKDIWCVGTWEGPGMWFKDTRADAVDIAVKAYTSWIMAPQQDTLRDKAKVALKGKNLACWCPVTRADGSRCPCHADVLLEIANA